MSGRVRLTIPLNRSSRGDAMAIAPIWADDSEARSIEGRPFIATFDSDDFVDEFFRLAERGESDHKRIAYRDWAEPPSAMLDLGGEPLYPTAEDIALTREEPWEGISEIGVDALPPEVPGGPDEPSWFRKLYLPIHGRFHVVATELVCKQPYYPAITPRRVLESGLVIRRARPQGPDSAVQWEDWITNGRGRGTWVVVTDEEMDPAAVTIEESLAKRLRERLEMEDDEPFRLTTAPTQQLPAVEVPSREKRTILWGYLPLSSDELEPVDLSDGESWKETRERWTVDAHEALKRALDGQADELRGVLLSGWKATIGALAGWSAPDPEEVIETILQGMIDIEEDLANPVNVNGLRNQLYAQLDRMTLRVIPGLWASADGSYQSDQDWLYDALAYTRHLAYSEFSKFQQLLTTHPTLTTHPDEFDELVRARFDARLQALIEKLDAGADLTATEARFLTDLSAIALRRVRALRAHLTDRVYVHLHNDGLIDLDDPLWRSGGEHRRPISPGGQIWDELRPGTLAGELRNWIAAHQEYDRVPREWSEMTFFDFPAFQLARHWHESFWRIESKLERFDLVIAAAGEALDPVLVEYRQRAVLRCQFTLADGGLDLANQPELGLLAFPGVDVDPERIEDFYGTVERPGENDDLVVDGEIPSQMESWDQAHVEQRRQAQKQVLLPRFDADHLYAAWTWARVASLDRCDPDQIVWSRRSEPFAIADVNDLLSSRPAQLRLPDLETLMRDLVRLPRTDARPFAAAITPQDSGLSVGGDPSDTRREWGIAWICSFGIPVFTICAWIMFRIIFSILIAIPGFIWMLLLKFCIPAPQRK